MTNGGFCFSVFFGVCFYKIFEQGTPNDPNKYDAIIREELNLLRSIDHTLKEKLQH